MKSVIAVCSSYYLSFLIITHVLIANTQFPPYVCPLGSPLQKYSDTCKQATYDYVHEIEGCINCVYLDADNNKAIGRGYCLSCDKNQTKIDLELIGANYDSIMAAVPIKSPFESDCRCSGDECLTQNQVDKLFDVKLSRSYQQALELVGEQSCCYHIAAVVDLIYFNGVEDIIANWAQFLHFIRTKAWDAAAQSIWVCHRKRCDKSSNYRNRCTADYDALRRGCDCVYGGCGRSESGYEGYCSGERASLACQRTPLSNGTCCINSLLCTDFATEGYIKFMTICDSCTAKCCKNQGIGYCC